MKSKKSTTNSNPASQMTNAQQQQFGNVQQPILQNNFQVPPQNLQIPVQQIQKNFQVPPQNLQIPVQQIQNPQQQMQFPVQISMPQPYVSIPTRAGYYGNRVSSNTPQINSDLPAIFNDD
jgi:hypothetical protein